MHLRIFLNSLGLIFDISGALLIWKFGLPESIRRGGEQFIVLEGINKAEKVKARNYDRFSHIGVILLTTGFGLQLVSNFC